MRVKNKFFFLYFIVFFFLLSCDNLFLRFKYETYECKNNQFKLKKVFIKNYKPGELVDVEIDNGAFKMEIVENTDQLMTIQREDPSIFIKINKNTNLLNVNLNNHISNIKCKNFIFKM